MGYDLSEDGLSKSKDKVKAIVAAPRPTTVTELKSFIGMVNYYSKFVNNLADKLSPLYNLLKKGVKFVWNQECESTFEKIKLIIASEEVLTYFNPDLPIIVTCDASERGIAGVLSHKMPDNTERTVCCISRTYSKSEQNYSTVHKESLACYFAVSKFQEYLFGHKFVLRSDQKSLISLFGKRKEINQTYANRIKRYALYFSNFDFVIEHIKGSDNVVADCLSRLPLQEAVDHEEHIDSNIYFANLEVPLDNMMVREETINDPVLKKIARFVQTQWPNRIYEEIKAYHNRKLDLYVENDCLYYGDRIVIPSSMQDIVLTELHATHEGIVRTKSMTRSYLWFPGIDKRIETMCKACAPCLSVAAHPPKTNIPWPESSIPFSVVHIDFFSFKARDYLVIIDSCTKWIEVYSMKNITSKTTVEMLRDCFSRFGLPRTIVSDNGPTFVSKEVEVLFHRNGIKHLRISPYNPQSNGLAENAVKTVKNKLKAALADEKNKDVPMSTLLARFLMINRNTPHTTTGISPAEAMFGRKLHTRVSMLKEKKPYLTNTNKTRAEREVRSYKVNDKVIVRDYRSTNKWMEATIVKKIANATYMCKTKIGMIWKRHPNQIKGRIEAVSNKADENVSIKTNAPMTRVGIPIKYPNPSPIPTTPDIPPGSSASPGPSAESEIEPEISHHVPDPSFPDAHVEPASNPRTNHNRPTRIVKLPNKFTDFVMDER